MNKAWVPFIKGLNRDDAFNSIALITAVYNSMDGDCGARWCKPVQSRIGRRVQLHRSIYSEHSEECIGVGAVLFVSPSTPAH